MPPSLNPLRVLIVAADQLSRAGLAAMLAQQSGVEVAGQAAEDDDINSVLEAYIPDVLVWDLSWNSVGSLARLSELPESAPPVVALLADDSMTAHARAAGAQGLLLRDSNIEYLVAALVAVARGLVVSDSSLAPPPAPLPISITDSLPQLTARESEALRLLAEGLPNKAIAGRLGISEHTVKFHVNSLMSKLGAQSRTEAVTRATRLGLLLL